MKHKSIVLIHLALLLILASCTKSQAAEPTALTLIVQGDSVELHESEHLPLRIDFGISLEQAIELLDSEGIEFYPHEGTAPRLHLLPSNMHLNFDAANQLFIGVDASTAETNITWQLSLPEEGIFAIEQSNTSPAQIAAQLQELHHDSFSYQTAATSTKEAQQRIATRYTLDYGHHLIVIGTNEQPSQLLSIRVQ
jgi:hypothetical protein